MPSSSWKQTVASEMMNYLKLGLLVIRMGSLQCQWQFLLVHCWAPIIEIPFALRDRFDKTNLIHVHTPEWLLSVFSAWQKDGRKTNSHHLGHICGVFPLRDGELFTLMLNCYLPTAGTCTSSRLHHKCKQWCQSDPENAACVRKSEGWRKLEVGFDGSWLLLSTT